MAAGELDQRITLQSLALVSDGGGGSTETWSNVAILWAKVVPMSGRERLQADQLESAGQLPGHDPAPHRHHDGQADPVAGQAAEYPLRRVQLAARGLYMTFDAEMGVQT
jgi:hypothetical protein